jgi:transaldolase
MANNPILKIKDYGQSIWMDNLNRDLIKSGELKKTIETLGLRGLTSNPTIFKAAIANNQIYDADIEAGIRAGKSVKEIYESLIFEDIRQACHLFRPVYEESGGLDGYVSIEVNPHLALDTAGTVEEAMALPHLW